MQGRNKTGWWRNEPMAVQSCTVPCPNVRAIRKRRRINAMRLPDPGFSQVSRYPYTAPGLRENPRGAGFSTPTSLFMPPLAVLRRGWVGRCGRSERSGRGSKPDRRQADRSSWPSSRQRQNGENITMRLIPPHRPGLQRPCRAQQRSLALRVLCRLRAPQYTNSR